MQLYRLSPHVYLESFEDIAVLLIADRDTMVTVKPAAAQLFTEARELIGNDLFSRSDCVAFLLAQFDLTPPEAEKQMRSILSFGLQQSLVTKQS